MALVRFRTACTLLVCGLWAAAVGAESVASPRAAAGVSLLGAAEGAVAVQVGIVRRPRQVDRHGWVAAFEVERTLTPPSDSQETPRSVGWEELAPERPVRFVDGERILVAVERPSGSLWRERLGGTDAWVVSARGRAFLRDPDAASVDALTRYLAVPPTERSGSSGIDPLCTMIAQGAPTLARGALQRLREVAGLATHLEPAATGLLRSVLANPNRPLDLRRDVARLAGQRRIIALRPALLAATQGDGAMVAVAWDALAELDGGLPVPRLDRLAQSEDPALRVVAARRSVGTPREERLPEAVRGDPDAEVRAAAIEAWVDARGLAALPVGIVALSDPDPAVQSAAARSLGGLGAAAVPALRDHAAQHVGREAAGALVALSLAGPEGRLALAEIAHTHPDAATRKLARLALGREANPH